MASIENPTDYGPGGFFPVTYQQFIQSPNTTYRIVHKLGVGSNAMCFLAENRDPLANPDVLPPDREIIPQNDTSPGNILPYPLPESSNDPNDPPNLGPYTPMRYVALKIESEYNPDIGNIYEAECQRRLADKGHAPEVYESFQITEKNYGRIHRCLAMEIVGPTLWTLIEDLSQRFDDRDAMLLPSRLARIWGAKLVRLVENCHQCGVAHGDLHPGNLAIGRPEIQDLSVNELHEACGGEPRLIPIPDDKWTDSMPVMQMTSVKGPDLWNLCGSEIDAPMLLLDFGNSWFSELNPRTGEPKDKYIRQPLSMWGPGTPYRLSAPEICLKKVLSDGFSYQVNGTRTVEYLTNSAADIWTMMCTLFAFFAMDDLFEWPLLKHFPDQSEINTCGAYLNDHVAALGKMPKRWWTNWWDEGEETQGVKQGKKHWSENANPLSTTARERREFSLMDRLDQALWDHRNGVQGEDLPQGDHQVLWCMLKGCIKWNPNDRPRASELAKKIPPEWSEGKESQVRRKRNPPAGDDGNGARRKRRRQAARTIGKKRRRTRK